MLSVSLSKIINIVLYQVGWFSCVLGAAYGYTFSGALAAAVLVMLHLYLTDNRKAEIQLVSFACLLGVLIDSLQQSAGLFFFKVDPRWPLWLPLWVLVVWAQFVTLFRFALHWLSGRYLLGALFGALGGPLAYWGGIRLGAASFGDSPLLTLAVLAVVWSGVTPLLLWSRQKLASAEGYYRLFPREVS
jgi:hypothetical protein